MRRKLFISALAAICLVFVSANAGEKKQSKLAAQAKITKAEAEKTALAKVPGGKVKESELEEEDGKLIWSFDIATKGSKDITEVHVDAITGAVIQTKSETAAHMAEKVGITKKQASQFFQALADLSYKQAKNTFTIPASASSSCARCRPAT